MLWEENRISYRAFWELHPERQVHMGGPGFIPLLAVIAWCALEDEEAKPLLRDIRAMDGAYLKFVSDRQKEESERRDREAERQAKGGQRARSGARR